MHQLIYVSQEAVPFSPADLKRLLARSRLRNHEAGLTGLLVYNQGVFLQVLEGDGDPVATAFTRIQSDARHQDIRIVKHDEKLLKRMFGQWSMGYPDATTAARVLRGFIPLSATPSLSSLDGDQAIELLLICAREGFVDRAA